MTFQSYYSNPQLIFTCNVPLDVWTWVLDGWNGEALAMFERAARLCGCIVSIRTQKFLKAPVIITYRFYLNFYNCRLDNVP